MSGLIWASAIVCALICSQQGVAGLFLGAKRAGLVAAANSAIVSNSKSSSRIPFRLDLERNVVAPAGGVASLDDRAPSRADDGACLLGTSAEDFVALLAPYCTLNARLLLSVDRPGRIASTVQPD
jgi:hypothetical protein